MQKKCPTAWDISGEASHSYGEASRLHGEASHRDGRPSRPDAEAPWLTPFPRLAGELKPVDMARPLINCFAVACEN